MSAALLPWVPPLGPSPLSSMAISSFYSELIQWDFSLLPLGLYNCFWLAVGIPSVLPTNPLVTRPLPLLRIHLLHHYTFCDKIPFCLLLLYTSTSRFKWIRIKLPHYLVLWHASDGPNHLLLFLGKIPSQQGILPKEITAGNQI